MSENEDPFAPPIQERTAPSFDSLPDDLKEFVKKVIGAMPSDEGSIKLINHDTNEEFEITPEKIAEFENSAVMKAVKAAEAVESGHSTWEEAMASTGIDKDEIAPFVHAMTHEIEDVFLSLMSKEAFNRLENEFGITHELVLMAQMFFGIGVQLGKGVDRGTDTSSGSSTADPDEHPGS